ncbi:MAG: 16S rRNA (guanine(966)-N(2))-methyltransferase RsmD [Candidatus Saccharimonadales bacterium]
MRVITGSLKGRFYDAPSGNHTHPMGDKVKGALFNTLGDIEGLSVLDAFAGSGALTIEAISRGAARAVAIDYDLEAFKTISRNCQKLGITDKVIVLRKNVNGWAGNNREKRFDLVLADPPYDDIRPTLIERLITLLSLNGLLVLSWPRNEEPRVFSNTQIIASKHFAGAQLVFYRKTS